MALAPKKPAPGKPVIPPVSKPPPAAGIDFDDDGVYVPEHRPEGKGEELIALNKIVGLLGRNEVIHRAQRFFCPDPSERERLLRLGAVKIVVVLKAEQDVVRDTKIIAPE